MGIREQGRCAGQDPLDAQFREAEGLTFVATGKVGNEDARGTATVYRQIAPRFVFGTLDAVAYLLSAENPWRADVDAASRRRDRALGRGMGGADGRGRRSAAPLPRRRGHGRLPRLRLRRDGRRADAAAPGRAGERPRPAHRAAVGPAQPGAAARDARRVRRPAFARASRRASTSCAARRTTSSPTRSSRRRARASGWRASSPSRGSTRSFVTGRPRATAPPGCAPSASTRPPTPRRSTTRSPASGWPTTSASTTRPTSSPAAGCASTCASSAAPPRAAEARPAAPGRLREPPPLHDPSARAAARPPRVRAGVGRGAPRPGPPPRRAPHRRRRPARDGPPRRRREGRRPHARREGRARDAPLPDVRPRPIRLTRGRR